MRRRRGFTLIELMIVVAIIGILAAIAVPKFADLLRKSREGAMKGTLGSIRSALSIYYGDNEGWFPSGPKATNSSVLSSSLVPRYLDRFPSISVPDFHAASTNIYLHEDLISGHTHDNAVALLYDGISPADSNWGTIWVACSHTDTKGSVWTTY